MYMYMIVILIIYICLQPELWQCIHLLLHAFYYIITCNLLRVFSFHASRHVLYVTYLKITGAFLSSCWLKQTAAGLTTERNMCTETTERHGGPRVGQNVSWDQVTQAWSYSRLYWIKIHYIHQFALILRPVLSLYYYFFLYYIITAWT